MQFYDQEEDRRERRKENPKRNKGPNYDLLSMDDYLKLRCRSRILQDLNRWLQEERPAEEEEPVPRGRILPGEWSMFRFDYWRLNRTDMKIQILTDAWVRTDSVKGPGQQRCRLYLKYWFSWAGRTEEMSLQKISCRNMAREERDLICLDRFLVPILGWKNDISAEAERIWERYLPETLRNHFLRTPDRLAAKMGLKIITLRLYGEPETRAFIAFRDMKVLVQPERAQGEKEDPPPAEENVPAGTIVMGVKVACQPYSHWDAFHECIHYEWHYLFFRLQEGLTTDLAGLRTLPPGEKRIPRADRCIVNLECQARRGSDVLMLPTTDLNRAVRELYPGMVNYLPQAGYQNHIGMRYDHMACLIAGRFEVPRSCVRRRLLETGHPAAEGILNYVGDRYITPFAFSNPGEKGTYVIDPASAAKLYRDSPGFRALMDTGRFVYADGHVVLRESAELHRDSKGYTLLGPWANAHMDQVALRFSREYISRRERYVYSLGRLNNEELLRRAYSLMDAAPARLAAKAASGGSSASGPAPESLKDVAWKMIGWVRDMPGSFHEALTYLMEKEQKTLDQLAAESMVSRRTLCRLRQAERDRYNPHQVVALCIALHLPPFVSEALAERAGLDFKKSDKYLHFRMILDFLYDETVENVQKTLKKSGLPLLKLKGEDLGIPKEEDSEEDTGDSSRERSAPAAAAAGRASGQQWLM